MRGAKRYGNLLLINVIAKERLQSCPFVILAFDSQRLIYVFLIFLTFRLFYWVEVHPPLWLSFEPPVIPSHYGLSPDYPFIIGHDVMILV